MSGGVLLSFVVDFQVKPSNAMNLRLLHGWGGRFLA